MRAGRGRLTLSLAATGQRQQRNEQMRKSSRIVMGPQKGWEGERAGECGRGNGKRRGWKEERKREGSACLCRLDLADARMRKPSGSRPQPRTGAEGPASGPTRAAAQWAWDAGPLGKTICSWPRKEKPPPLLGAAEAARWRARGPAEWCVGLWARRGAVGRLFLSSHLPAFASYCARGGQGWLDGAVPTEDEGAHSTPLFKPRKNSHSAWHAIGPHGRWEGPLPLPVCAPLLGKRNGERLPIHIVLKRAPLTHALLLCLLLLGEARNHRAGSQQCDYAPAKCPQQPCQRRSPSPPAQGAMERQSTPTGLVCLQKAPKSPQIYSTQHMHVCSPGCHPTQVEQRQWNKPIVTQSHYDNGSFARGASFRLTIVHARDKGCRCPPTREGLTSLSLTRDPTANIDTSMQIRQQLHPLRVPAVSTQKDGLGSTWKAVYSAQKQAQSGRPLGENTGEGSNQETIAGEKGKERKSWSPRT